MNKYEKLIEYIINENEQKARELFHEIVVEKSRDIYESLMDEEQVEENFGAGNPADQMINDVSDQTDDIGLGEEDEEGAEFSIGDEEGAEDEMGGDLPADGGDEFGGDDLGGDDMGGEGDLKSDLEEIKDKIDQLLADVGGSDLDSEEGLGGDEEMGGEEEFGGEEFGGEEEMGSEEGEEAFAETKPAFAESKSVAQLMREYVDTIGQVYGGEGDNAEGTESGNGKKLPVNTKSVTRTSGPDFGGTSKNIARGGAEQAADGKQTPKPNNEYSKGETKMSNEKFQNVAGGSKKQSAVGKNWESDKGAEGQTTSGKAPVSNKTVLKQNTGK